MDGFGAFQNRQENTIM